MAILTEDMKCIVQEQGLGFHAPSAKMGRRTYLPRAPREWDDDHLFFADIRSPNTAANIRRGSLVEVNVVDPFVRKGYRFKGPAVIHDPGSDGFAGGLKRMRDDGVAATLLDRVKAIVVIEVRQAGVAGLLAYDDGTISESDMVDLYQARFARLNERTRQRCRLISRSRPHLGT